MICQLTSPVSAAFDDLTVKPTPGVLTARIAPTAVSELLVAMMRVVAVTALSATAGHSPAAKVT